MDRDEKYKIELDIDRTRKIRDILSETYVRGQELLGVEFSVALPDFLSKIEPYLASNRISTIVALDLPSDKIPDLRIEVNIRKKSVFARSRFKKKRILFNYYLKTL